MTKIWEEEEEATGRFLLSSAVGMGVTLPPFRGAGRAPRRNEKTSLRLFLRLKPLFRDKHHQRYNAGQLHRADTVCSAVAIALAGQ